MAVETAPVCGQNDVMLMVSDETLKAQQGQFQKTKKTSARIQNLVSQQIQTNENRIYKT